MAIFCAFSLCLAASVALPAAKQLAAMRTCVLCACELCAEVVVMGRGGCGLMPKGAKGFIRDEGTSASHLLASLVCYLLVCYLLAC